MGSFQGLGWCPSGKALEKHHSPGRGPLRVEGIPPAGQEAPAHHAQGSTRPPPRPAPGRQRLPWMMPWLLQAFTPSDSGHTPEPPPPTSPALSQVT